LTYKRRLFRTSSPAITHARGVRVRGVVIASYPLRPSPELGGKGMALRADGVFFELYRVVGRPRRPAPAARLPLTIFDFATLRGMPSATETGAASFSVKGRDYRAIIWVGAKAPKLAQIVIDEVVGSIRIK
jgi:hypothetical protein